MFELDKVNFSYPNAAGLIDVSLTIAPGSAVALMGPNGSGKSTLFKLLCGLLKQTSGRYTVDGKEPDFDVLRQRLGFVFQNSDVQLFNETVKDELAFGPQQLGLDEELVKQRVSDVLTLLDIARMVDRVPYQLSGGEKKLVALGSVLTMNPNAIILDEPFNGLSISYQDRLTKLLSELHAAGKTLILSSHNFKQIAPLVDEVIALGEDHRVSFATKKADLTGAQIELLERL